MYNSPEWAARCIQCAILSNAESIKNIYVIDDNSEQYTENLLISIARENDKIIYIRNSTNVGFVNSANLGLKKSSAKYVLLLNSDCLLTENAIAKLISHVEVSNRRIGLVSPISNNSPIISYRILSGYNYITMNELFGQLFLGESFDACTIVGNCLLMTRECINDVGYLNEIYGKGYGEETDYQFAAAEKGYEAIIAIDTYVFHKGEASFESGEDISEHRKVNSTLFFTRWGDQYIKKMKKYKKNDPIKYIDSKIRSYFKKSSSKFPNYDVVYYLPGIGQTFGGIHNVVEIVNELIIRNINAAIVVPSISQYFETLLFEFIVIEEEYQLFNITTNCIVATAWNTVYPCSSFSTKTGIPLVYYVQGFESYFYNGERYGRIEKTFSIVDEVVVISDWLENMVVSRFNKSSTKLVNGFNEHLFHPCVSSEHRQKIVTIVLRGDSAKGDWVLLDLLKLLIIKNMGIQVNVVYFRDIEFPENDENIVKIFGPLKKKSISQILQSTDIFVDASLHEGFGMFPIEAMACGAVVIVSDSGGVSEFIKDEINGIIVKEVNKPEEYLKKIQEILADEEKHQRLRDAALRTVKEYYIDKTINKHIDFIRSFPASIVRGKKNVHKYFSHEAFSRELQNSKLSYNMSALEELDQIKRSFSYRLIDKMKKNIYIHRFYSIARKKIKKLYKLSVK